MPSRSQGLSQVVSVPHDLSGKKELWRKEHPRLPLRRVMSRPGSTYSFDEGLGSGMRW